MKYACWLLGAVMVLHAAGPIIAAEPEPVVIGALYNLTGSQAGLDAPSARGAQLAVDAANREGGVLGRQVRLIRVDGESQAALIKRRTAEVLRKFPALSALMGFSDTDMVLAAAPLAARHGRPFVTSGATSPRLPGQVPTYLFLACFGDNVQAAAAAEWLYRTRSAHQVVVLFNAEMEYTRLLHGYFAERFRQLGGKVLQIVSYTPGTVARVLDKAPPVDAVFVAAGPEDAVTVTLQLRQTGYAGLIVGGDGFDSDAWQKHPQLKNVFFTTHAYLGADNRDPRMLAFRNAYLAAYPGSTPDAFAALGYDTARLIIAAIGNAGSADPARVLKALAGMERFEGVTGTLSYPAGTRVPRKSVTIIGYEGGERRLISQLMPERVPAP